VGQPPGQSSPICSDLLKTREWTVRVRFVDCLVDLDARRVARGGRDLHLTPKAFALLSVLIENRTRAVSKSELLERVWPKVFVSDASVARTITEIREALGDHGRDGHIVRTVHGYGYAFAADVEVESAQHATIDTPSHSQCCLVWRARTFGLPCGEHFAGRDPDVTVWLDSPKVSRRHARLVVSGTSTTIEDLRSKNGTFVRGTRLSAPAFLEDGDDVRIGPFSMTFRSTSHLPATETDTRST
jgi:DNA-binding winged helix-turn-helix (wHTH) protein